MTEQFLRNELLVCLVYLPVAVWAARPCWRRFIRALRSGRTTP